MSRVAGGLAGDHIYHVPSRGEGVGKFFIKS